MAPTRFAFMDEGEALRRLNVDRDTLQALVREGRLKAHGVGIHHYYRTKDVDALHAELYSEGTDVGEAAPQMGKGPAGSKLFDPAYKVHVRLQADLKWYDLADDDLRAWAREMTEDGYPRQRANVQMVIGKLQRMIELMDEAAANWRVLKPAHPVPGAAAPTAEQEGGAAPAKPAESRRGKPLAMFGAPGMPASTQTAPAVPAPAPQSGASSRPTESRRGKPLAMFGGAGASTPMPTPPAPTPVPAPTPAQPAATSRRGKPLPLAGTQRPAEPPKSAEEEG